MDILVKLDYNSIQTANILTLKIPNKSHRFLLNFKHYHLFFFISSQESNKNTTQYINSLK